MTYFDNLTAHPQVAWSACLFLTLPILKEAYFSALGQCYENFFFIMNPHTAKFFRNPQRSKQGVLSWHKIIKKAL